MNSDNDKLKFVSRNEIKYIVDYQTAVNIRSKLGVYLPLENHCNNGPYRVKSLYFDSWNNQDLYEKIQGEEERKKLRLRIYDEKDIFAKMELKAKKGNYSNKYSILCNNEEAKQIIEGNYSILLDKNSEVAELIYKELVMGFYHPKVIIEYDRYAYEYPLGNTRITFDENVRVISNCTDLTKKELPYINIDPTIVILEVKFNGELSNTVKNVLKEFNLNQNSFSKYANSRMMINAYI